MVVGGGGSHNYYEQKSRYMEKENYCSNQYIMVLKFYPFTPESRRVLLEKTSLFTMINGLQNNRLHK